MEPGKPIRSQGEEISQPPELHLGAGVAELIRKSFDAKPSPLPRSTSIPTTSVLESSPLKGPPEAKHLGNVAVAVGLDHAVEAVSKGLGSSLGAHVVIPRSEDPKTSSAAGPAFADAVITPLDTPEGKKAPPIRQRDPRVYRYQKDNVDYGFDRAFPIETKTEALKSLGQEKQELEKERNQLQQKLETLSPDENQRLFALNRRIGLCDRARSWTDSREGEFRASGDIDEALTKGRTREGVFSVELTNAYEEQFVDESGNNQGSFLRFGVMTHAGQGLLNLRMLKGLVEGNKEERENAATALTNLRGKYKKESPAQTQAFKDALATLKQEKPDETGTTAASRALEERRFVLQHQMLQFLSKQITDHAHGKELHLFQLSLLNPSNRKVNKNGMSSCEANEMLDEAEIFKELNGKEIKLDAGLKSPYIDAQGTFHVPKPARMKQESVRVLLHFGNVAVQKKVKPGDQQVYREVNKDLFDSMKLALEGLAGKKPPSEIAAMQAKLKKCRAAIEAGKSSYYVAEDLTEIGRFLGWNLSLNCHSGKDRTGFIAFRVIQQILAKVIDKKSLEKKASSIKQYFASQVYDAKNIPRLVCQANGWLHLKVAALKLPGLESLPGRVSVIWEMAQSFIEQKTKSSKISD